MQKTSRQVDLTTRTAPGFSKKWKESWELKMTLMNWRETKSSWKVIARDFERNGVKKFPSAWRCMWRRCNAEVNAMAKAATVDKEGEYDRILGLVWRLGAIARATEADFDGVWNRISAAMRKYGSTQSWTPQKVEYAWKNGVSTRFLHIKVCPFLG